MAIYQLHVLSAGNQVDIKPYRRSLLPAVAVNGYYRTSGKKTSIPQDDESKWRRLVGSQKISSRRLKQRVLPGPSVLLYFITYAHKE